jgi:hypothetical protein
MSSGMDWAICTPISTKGPDCWCLYVSGSTDFIATPDTLSADLRFTALMAEFIGAIRQVRQLEKVHAGMSQFFSPAVVETMSGEFGSSLLAPKISDVMLDTLHADFRPEHVSKQVEFGIAESAAGRRGRTDGAMVLDENETRFVLALVFGHAGYGLATQRINAASRLCVVEAILSGTHEPGTSLYELLRACTDDETLSRASAELNAAEKRPISVPPSRGAVPAAASGLPRRQLWFP